MTMEELAFVELPGPDEEATAVRLAALPGVSAEAADEALALSAIFASYGDTGGDAFLLHVRPAGPGPASEGGVDAAAAPTEEPSTRFTLVIEPELPEGGEVRFAAAQAQASTRASTPSRDTSTSECGMEDTGDVSDMESEECLVAFSAAHLPPFLLTGRFVASYPEASAPAEMTLRADWLPTSALRAACEALGQLAGELVGGPLLFDAAEWLRTAAADALGLTSKRAVPVVSLSARESSFVDAGEGKQLTIIRPVFAAGSVDERLAAAMTASAVARRRHFEAAMQHCGVCLEYVPGAKFPPELPLCAHRPACASCFASLCATAVRSGDLTALRCPEQKCGKELAPSAVRAALVFAQTMGEDVDSTVGNHVGASTKEAQSEDMLSRWERLSLQRFLDTSADIGYCPLCASPVVLEGDMGECADPACRHLFCAACGMPWHAGRPCPPPAMRVKVRRAQAAGGGGSESLAALERAARRDAANVAASLELIERSTVRCPGCGQATAKSEGCNKMTCVACGRYWCYRCRKLIDGYSHFSEGQCVLFEEQDVDEWERYMAMMGAANPRNAVRRARQDARRGAGREGEAVLASRRCAWCGARGRRAGRNNHVRCASCARGFCFQCGERVQSCASHFGTGAGKCRQHS